ncbi:MAG: DNA-binding domain-containing protein [Byssovorax sp.]
MTPPREPLDAVMAFLEPAFRRVDALEGDATIAGECAAHVTGNSRLTPAEQVDIYRRQYWLRHVDALADDYPGVAYLLGEEGFDAFLRAYLLAHPPRHKSLRDLGADVVAFSQGHAFPAALRAVTLEMIAYEHAFIDLFDGAEPPPLDPQKLTSMPEDAWERARIVIHPLLVRRQVRFAVHRLRLQAKSSDVAPLAAPPSEAPANLVLFRDDNQIRFEELDGTAFALLDALARGEALGPACEEVAATLDAEAADQLGAQVGPWFQQWTARRWIVDVVV